MNVSAAALTDLARTAAGALTCTSGGTTPRICNDEQLLPALLILLRQCFGSRSLLLLLKRTARCADVCRLAAPKVFRPL